MFRKPDKSASDVESKNAFIDSVITIQRAFRRRQFINKSEKISKESESLEEKCHADFQRLKINMPPPLPKKEFVVDKAKAESWVEAHPESLRPLAKKMIQSIVHRSQKKFEATLRATLKDFMRTLMSYPVSQRDYLLVLPDDGFWKSSGWVAGLAMSYLQVKPRMVKTAKEAVEYMKLHADIKQCLFVDDCIYSGKQFSANMDMFAGRLSRAIGLEKMNQRQMYFHVCVPFVTLHGHRHVVLSTQSELTENNIKMLVHEYQPVLTMSVFAKMGIFNESEFETLVENHHNRDATPFGNVASLYFDHKTADRHSTLLSILSGETIDGKHTVRFIEDEGPPYYVPYKSS